MLRIRSKKIWFVVAAVASVLFCAVADRYPVIIDYYRQFGVIPFIASIYSRLTGLLPFSLAEMLIYITVIFIMFYIVIFVVNVIKKQDKKKYLIKVLWNIISVASVLITMYMMLCGVYYSRRGINEYMGFEVRDYDADDLYETSVYLVGEINKIYDKVDISKNIILTELSKETVRIYKDFSKKHKEFNFSYGRPKTILLSRQLSYTGIVGIFMPFTMEANINGDVELYTIPASMCHEMAHMYGFMREDEANYISYKVCIESDNVLFKLSGLMAELLMCQNELFFMDIEKYDKVEAMIPEKTKELSNTNDEYWNEIESTDVGEVVTDVAQDVNDTYLKFNGEEDGIITYNQVVGLIVSDYLKQKNDQKSY